MKLAVVIVFVLVGVATASAGPPAGDDPKRGAPPPRLRDVRFEGNTAFETGALKKVLKDLQARRVIPGIWTRRPMYTAPAVEADLARLRSFYVSHGYFGAQVGVGGVTVDGGEAVLTLEVLSGPRQSVHQVQIEGIPRAHGKTALDSSGELPVADLCSCLLEARRIAGSRGQLDFAVELEVSPASASTPPGPGGTSVDVTARVRTGSAYTVGRINFSGHHRTNDSTLRRAMALRERSVFDVGKLRTSLARLNTSGLFQSVTLDDVRVRTNPDTRTADLTITVREQRSRHWSLSGPLAPLSLVGSLQATISSRLPPWGRGILEASTYRVAFSLTGISNPLIRLLPTRARRGPRALLILERPALPGQLLQSGFALSPQLSARSMLENYGLTHLDLAVRAAFAGEPRDSSSLLIPTSGPDHNRASRRSDETRFLICDPPAPSRWLRGAVLAAELAISAFRPF